MIETSKQQPQDPLGLDTEADNAASIDSAHRENQGGDNSFFYANFCLGIFPVDPLDFHAFAKGQLMAMAIFVPAAIGLFIFFAF